KLGPGEPGTALIALRSGAPVLPVAIWGTEHVKLPRDLFRRTKAHVRFGESYRLPNPGRITREAIAAGTDEIMHRIAELLPAEYRGEYLDTSTPPARWLPRFTGRCCGCTVSVTRYCSSGTSATPRSREHSGNCPTGFSSFRASRTRNTPR